MIGSIIGAGLSAVSSIAGGISSAIANRKAKKKSQQAVLADKAENTAWYNRRYNEDGMQRADAQSALRELRDTITERNRNAQATQAITGGTDESLAANNAANAKAMTDTVAAIEANAASRKDSIENSYRTADKQANDRLAAINSNYNQTRANNIAQTVTSAGQTAASIASSLDSAEPTTTANATPPLKAEQKTALDNQIGKMQDQFNTDAHNQLQNDWQKQARSIFDIAAQTH